MSYKSQRNYENAQRMLFDGIGQYEIPEIEPTQIIFYGRVPDECKGNIVHIKQFTEKWNKAEVAQW